MTSLEQHRLSFLPQLPASLNELKSVVFNETSSSSSTDPEVEKLLPNTKGQPFLEGKRHEKKESNALRVGVVLSGGQAAGGHNVITGLYDALMKLNPSSMLFGFLNGPAGIIENNHIELTQDFLASYRNQGGFDMIGSGRTKIETDEQFKAAEETARALDLDGLVIIGGDDSNTNAALLAEYFVNQGVKTRVVGVPKTIDGDLKNEHIEVSFGFDTATKVYSEIIGNIARDALSAGKYYFFIKLMGRSASHIALECALQTHPNYTVIGEEVSDKRKTVRDITNEICDVICNRAENGVNHGVILIPEGTIEFIPEVGELIRELNDLLSKKSPEEATQQLSQESKACYENLPSEIQAQLILDRDPHGNVQVSKIETERLFLELVKKELKKRKEAGSYKGKFSAQPYFCGYEGRSGLPSNFDTQYCYALGHVAALLIDEGVTGYMACVQHLAAHVSEWKIAGIPISSMMVMEQRKGKLKPVIQKALVELDGKPFSIFNASRAEWSAKDHYRYPGPIQFFGPEEATDTITITLSEESKKAFI